MRADVQQYLISMRTYLWGDLDTFKRVCDEVELQEKGKEPIPHSTGSAATGTSGLGSSSTTIETTNKSGNAGTSGNPPNHGRYPTLFRSTIPHALAVLATIDIMGYLIGTEKNADGTEKNITLFLHPEVTNPDFLNCLVFIYRHGMGHSFFPKVQISIAAHSTLEGKDLFYIDSGGIITLNVNALIGLMKTKFDSIMADTTIHTNIENQYDKQQSEDVLRLTKRGLDLSAFASTLKTFNDL